MVGKVNLMTAATRWLVWRKRSPAEKATNQSVANFNDTKMNDKIKIPDGWYQLETNEIIEDGDMWLFNNGTWVETYFSGVHVSKNTVYIRKEKKEK